MLDRLISGAGAVTDGADRSVRLLTSRSTGRSAAARPGSVAVAAALFVLAALLLLAGIESTDTAAPVSLDPAMVAGAATRALGDRTYATLDGSLMTDWVETFEDTNDNGIEDADEHGVAWFYWLVDPAQRRGVTVRSTRAPASVFRFEGSGIVIPDPGYPVEEEPWFDAEVKATGLDVDPTTIIDATGAVGETVPVDLGAGLPSVGTAVAVAGSRTGGYRTLCTHDLDGDGVCDREEVDRLELAVFDPTSKRAVRVLLRERPEFSTASLTGLLRREERAVDDARSTKGLDFGAMDIVVSNRYILDDAAPPAAAPLAFVLALALAAVAGTILVGLAGGYLIYRRATGLLPAPASTFAPGERLPLRLSGVVRTRTGLEHLREAPSELVRFVRGRPVGSPDAPETPEASEVPPLGDAAATTTLIVERTGLPSGVALGRGELKRLSVGQVMTFRAPRPALRVVAGTGPLLLSFDTAADRDRAAAELLDESGFGPDGGPMASA